MLFSDATAVDVALLAAFFGGVGAICGSFGTWTLKAWKQKHDQAAQDTDAKDVRDRRNRLEESEAEHKERFDTIAALEKLNDERVKTILNLEAALKAKDASQDVYRAEWYTRWNATQASFKELFEGKAEAEKAAIKYQEQLKAMEQLSAVNEARCNERLKALEEKVMVLEKRG